MNLNQLSFLGESASPFIDEGDGLTSEREKVRMFLNPAAHAGRYRMMVGAHNTVGCRMHVGGSVVLFLGMADVSTCYTVDAHRHVRSFTMFTQYGKCQRPQHYQCPEACGGFYRVCLVWELMAPTTLYGKSSAPTTLPRF